MTPRVRVQFVDAETSVSEVLLKARHTGLSRYPVTGEGGADEIVGVVDVRQALRVPRDERSTTPVRGVAVDPLFVPEAMELDTLLRQLRRSRSPLAVVVDEYGGTAGIVTLEDLIEELVGDVEDEHDPRVARVTLSADGSYVITGLLRPDEVRTLGVDVPDDEHYETVSGYLADALDRLPELGDEVRVGRWSLRVTRMDGLRVDRIRMTPGTEADDEEAPA
jgi:CBS domain containing-hemolysin-like protein